jgi:hypothetical protein
MQRKLLWISRNVFVSMHRGSLEQRMGISRDLDSGAGLLPKRDAWTTGRIGNCSEFRRQCVLWVVRLRIDRRNATCEPNRTYRNSELMSGK